MAHFNVVEANMKLRYALASTQLTKFAKDESLLSASFPALGTPDFTHPQTKPNPKGVGGSVFFPDEAIYQGHPR